MFTLTQAASLELKNRLEVYAKPFIRLQMRKSCFMKVKVTVEDVVHANDIEVNMNGMSFIIDSNECHYFRNKTLDFIPDQTGFKEFEIL